MRNAKILPIASTYVLRIVFKASSNRKFNYVVDGKQEIHFERFVCIFEDYLAIMTSPMARSIVKSREAKRSLRSRLRCCELC